MLDLRLRPVAFPEPVGRVNGSLVWSWYDVERWGRFGLPDRGDDRSTLAGPPTPERTVYLP